jgi:hypothetical protein
MQPLLLLQHCLVSTACPATNHVSRRARYDDFRCEQRVAHRATSPPHVSQHRSRCQRPATGLRCQRSTRDDEALQQASINTPNGEKTNISARGCAGPGGRKILVSPLPRHAQQGLQVAIAIAMVVNLLSAPLLPQHQLPLAASTISYRLVALSISDTRQQGTREYRSQ